MRSVVTEHSVTLRGFDGNIYTGFLPDGKGTFAPTEISDRIGPSIDYVLTVTKPGYDPYTFTGTTSAYTTRPSCEDLSGNNGTTIPVQAWSAKYAQLDPQVRKTLTVSDTRAVGAHVGYVWTVTKAPASWPSAPRRSSAAVTARSRSSAAAYRGQQIALTVTVTKGTGKRAKVLTKTLNYGKVT